mgnify:CR=1 FL=1
MVSKMHVIHPLKPIYDRNSIILILGSFPSVKSREKQFYYGHPKNRFWSVLAKVFNEEIEDNNQAKENFLLKHHIALFDVIKECEINGSSDNTIKNIIPNDINKIIADSKIKYIFTVGNKAHQLYQKYLLKDTNINDTRLPSTSPANCKKGIDNILYNSYKILKLLANNESD